MIGKAKTTFSPLSFFLSRSYIAPTNWKKHSVPKVFMDLKLSESTPAHRIVFELFEDKMPLTVENFRRICRGDVKSKEGKPLSYKGTKIFSVKPGLGLQGGDIVNNNGTGGHSIYGRYFRNEAYNVRHDKRGILSMAAEAVDKNDSKFLVTFHNASWLDQKYTAFGEIIYGMDVLGQIERLGSPNGLPRSIITIENCGELEGDDYYRFNRKVVHDVLAPH